METEEKTINNLKFTDDIKYLKFEVITPENGIELNKSKNVILVNVRNTNKTMSFSRLLDNHSDFRIRDIKNTYSTFIKRFDEAFTDMIIIRPEETITLHISITQQEYFYYFGQNSDHQRDWKLTLWGHEETGIIRLETMELTMLKLECFDINDPSNQNDDEVYFKFSRKVNPSKDDFTIIKDNEDKIDTKDINPNNPLIINESIKFTEYLTIHIMDSDTNHAPSKKDDLLGSFTLAYNSPLKFDQKSFNLNDSAYQISYKLESK